MAQKRNSYLVSKALKTFMFASVLASLAQRLATMTDAVVVSNLIGPDGISAINVVTPIITLFPTISILFGIGGSILAAKAIGRRDASAANSVFTMALMASFVSGLLLTVILFLLTPEIVALVCPRDSRFFDLAVSFMHVMSLSAVPTIMGFTLQTFVKTDGNPRLVMVTVMSGTLLNLILDVVFIKYLDMGIAGSAWGTIICFVFSMSVCLFHFRGRHSTFRLSLSPLTSHPSPLAPRSSLLSIVREGFPMSINTLLMGVCIFGFNSIVIHTLGADGMYVWSVCLQLLMLIQLMLGGVSSSIYSVGGLLVGERDMTGLTILFRRVLVYVGIPLSGLLVMVVLWPQLFGSLFGGGDSGVADLLHMALRIFALLLLPYAFLAVVSALYQLLGYRILSVVISLGQLVAMLFAVWLFSHVSPALLWWGFPASSVILAVSVLLFTWAKHLRQPTIAAVTLIPRQSEGESLNISIRLTGSDVESALSRIAAFLEGSHIPQSTVHSVSLCCEELLYNIVKHAFKRRPDRHCVDVHIRCEQTLVSVLLKDDGRPFNPTLKQPDQGTDHLGLLLVNGSAQNMTYQYMYDQNIVYMTFDNHH